MTAKIRNQPGDGTLSWKTVNVSRAVWQVVPCCWNNMSSNWAKILGWHSTTKIGHSLLLYQLPRFRGKRDHWFIQTINKRFACISFSGIIRSQSHQGENGPFYWKYFFHKIGTRFLLFKNLFGELSPLCIVCNIQFWAPWRIPALSAILLSWTVVVFCFEWPGVVFFTSLCVPVVSNLSIITEDAWETLIWTENWTLFTQPDFIILRIINNQKTFESSSNNTYYRQYHLHYI